MRRNRNAKRFDRRLDVLVSATLEIDMTDRKQTLCNTCGKANVSCPVFPQETMTCVEYAPNKLTERERHLVRVAFQNGYSFALFEEENENVTCADDWLAQEIDGSYGAIVEMALAHDAPR